MNESKVVLLLLVFGAVILGITPGCQNRPEPPTTTITPVVPTPTGTPAPLPPPPQPSTADKIKEIAEKKTVVISHSERGNLVGAGVIIGENSSKVYVLTARHVIGIQPQLVEKDDGTSEPEDPYIITTYDGEEFKVSYDNYDKVVKIMPDNTDLAVLELESAQEPGNKDRGAKLTTSVLPNKPVYIFGYLPCSQSAKSGKIKRDQLSSGSIEKFETNPIFDKDLNLGGYDIYYNNNTIQSMSGSPVFDERGHLVAIHAKTEKPDKSYNTEACKALPLKPNPDYGNNWGISVNRFLKFQEDLPEGLRSILPPVPPPGTEPPHTPQPSPTPTPGVNCGPFRDPLEVCPEEKKP